MDRGDLLLAVLAQRVVGVAVDAHRAGAVERAEGGDVLEVVRLHHAQQGPVARGVELEHAQRVAPGQQLVGGLVGQRQAEQVDLDLPVVLDRLDRVAHDREVAQAEEVHLQQAEALAGRVVELRDHRAVGVPGPHRDVVGQRLGRHDHPGRVHAGLADQPLDALGGVDDLLDLGLGGVEVAQVAGLAVAGVALVEDAAQRDVLAHHGGGERLGDAVAEGVGEAEDPGRVLDGGLRLDRPVGDDLGDLVASPALGDVADDVGPPALVEVDVDVGHRDALGVEEPLEDQAVVERVEVGDAHRVGDDAPGALPRPGPTATPLFFAQLMKSATTRK